MKLTSTIKNFKNNIIGYFSSSKSNGGGDNEGLYVIPASLLNGNKSILGFNWNKFVKAEFVTKEFDNLLRLTKGNQYSGGGGKINISLGIARDTLYIDGSNDPQIATRISINRDQERMVVVNNNSSIIQANELITNFFAKNANTAFVSFTFEAQSTSSTNTTDDISRFLGCINIYYKP